MIKYLNMWINWKHDFLTIYIYICLDIFFLFIYYLNRLCDCVYITNICALYIWFINKYIICWFFCSFAWKFWKFCCFCNATLVSRLCLGNVWSCFVGVVWTGMSSLVYECMEELSKFIVLVVRTFCPYTCQSFVSTYSDKETAVLSLRPGIF